MDLTIIDKHEEIHNYWDLLDTKDTEFGYTYICRHFLIYEFNYKNLYDSFLENLKIHYKDALFEKEFTKYIPQAKEHFETEDETFIIVFDKPSDYLNLEDVMRYGQEIEEIPERQRIWIMNRLLNLTCFFDLGEISQNGLLLENCYISFKQHNLILFGGWQYSNHFDEKIQSCSKKVYTLLPFSVKNSGITNKQVDLACVIDIGKKLFKNTEHISLYDFFFNTEDYYDIFKLYTEWEKETLSIYERNFHIWEEINIDNLY